MALFKQGETVVDLSTGQQFDVKDGDVELDTGKYGRIESGAKVSPADARAGAVQAQADEALLKQAGQQAGKEAGEFHGGMLQNVGVPLAQAGLAAATGGMSIPAQMLISGGGELAAQASGLAPESKTQLGLATVLPGIGKVVQRIGRVGGQMIGRVSKTPQQVSEVGQEAMAKVVGAEPDIIKRSLQTPASGQLYEAARSQGPVSTAQLKTYIDDALREQVGMSTPDTKTVERLSGLSRKLAANPSLDAKDVIDELQTLGQASTQAFKKGATVRGTALSKATQGAKLEAGLTQEADIAYGREQDIKRILKAGASTNPAAAIDEVIRKAGTKINLADEELREIKAIAHRVGRLSTREGLVGGIVEKTQGVLSQMIGDQTGRAMLRRVLGPEGKTSPAAISTALQFWRAYEAQKGRE